jgi:hypothetical protein
MLLILRKAWICVFIKLDTDSAQKRTIVAGCLEVLYLKKYLPLQKKNRYLT